VVPSWDLRTLWVNSDQGNSLTPIDPLTGKRGRRVAVEDPYNLYFTPDGKHALVMAERMHRIDVRDPHTMRLQRSLSVPCAGVNHADYSADLSFFVASCEFSGKLIVVDRDATTVRGVIDLNRVKTPGATSPGEAMQMPGSPKNGLRPGASAMPQDVRLTPDGRYFLSADMLRNGVWVIDASTLRVSRFIHTGLGAHGLYPSRDASRIFVSNRDEGTISVLDARTLAISGVWTIPGGGSPDMGGITADGRQLWLSGRYDAMVYVFDTSTGKVLHRIKVDSGPHGLAVWPQPGRFSLGHTGNTR
jgi:DNA-binding beta-propeller fold protein YncE